MVSITSAACLRGPALALLVAALIGVAGCGGPSAAPPAPAAGPPSETPTPPSLATPPGHRLVLTMSVERGSQVYACGHGAWTLLAPAAVLTSPTTDALHTAGPRWISTADGSAVTAAQVATVPVEGAAPQLLLHATAHDGDGLFGTVDFVQRLNTRGGQAPTGPCADGQQRAVPYDAEYRFWAPGP